MRRLLSRTSITIDEAVSILLGRSTGPIDFESMDEAEDAEANRPVFCLRETLEDELEVLEGEYRLAKYEKQSEQVVADRLAAMERHSATMERADVYRCAIDHELNKGEQSVLKVDRALSNAAYTYITRHSFNQWVKCREGAVGGQPGAAVLAESVPAPVEGSKEKAPRTKGQQQLDAVLDEIKKQKFDPKDLPPNPAGQRGVKDAVRKAVRKMPLFDTKSAFKRAWDELSARDLIAYRARPSSPKKVAGGDL